VINDLSFPQNEKLLRESQELSACIAKLKARCTQAGIPAIYVNNNFGKWRSDFSEVVRNCLRGDAPGRKMVEALLPDQLDCIVQKPSIQPFMQRPSIL
jgi:isochorismate hydrolase